MEATVATPPHRAPRRRGPTRADIGLLVVLLACVPGLRFVAPSRAGAKSDILLVRAANAPERRIDARQNADISIAGPLGETVLHVEDGAAWIASAPCRNQLCRRMGRITRPGRALVCLPNRVLVMFAGEPEGSPVGVDAVTR